jgi:uncharacterized protein YhfF
VIRTTAVQIVPCDEVTGESAATEGEVDGSPTFWRDAHGAAFSRDLDGSERPVRLDIPESRERFEVVFTA